MNNNEIMIEDWVFDRNAGVHRQIDSEDFFFGRVVYFEPIPLTPEILEKNGFVIMSKNTYVYYNSANDGYIKISLYDLQDGEWELHVDNYEKFDDSHHKFIIDKDFLNVHQLQNALRLCGINKTIEL